MRSVSTPIGGLSSSGAASGWARKTLEITGFCTFKERYQRGGSSEFAAAFLEKVRDAMGHAATGTCWSRTEAANRYTYKSKLVMVPAVSGEDRPEEHRRDHAFEMNDMLATILQQVDFRTNDKLCYIAAQASPARHDLFVAAGKITFAPTFSGGEKLQTRRGFSGGGLRVRRQVVSEGSKDNDSGRRGGPGKAKVALVRIGVGVALGMDPTSLWGA